VIRTAANRSTPSLSLRNLTGSSSYEGMVTGDELPRIVWSKPGSANENAGSPGSEKTTLLGSLVNRGNPPPVFFSDRLEAERGNVFFQRRLFGG
jgi:hypothetical protein